MFPFSRRSFVKHSPLAAIAVCMPEVWSQAAESVLLPQKPKLDGPMRGLLNDFLDSLRDSRSYIIECAQAMPEEKYSFRPVPEVRSFGQQMVHIAETNAAIMEARVEEKKVRMHHCCGYSKEKVTSKADVIAQLNESYDYVEKGASQMTDEMLRARTKINDETDVSKLWGLHMIHSHAAHHGGQIDVYLRLNVITPPGLVGPPDAKGGNWFANKVKSGPIAGTWECMSHGWPQGDMPFTLYLEQQNENVSGIVSSPLGSIFIRGTFKKNDLETRTIEGPEGEYLLSAKLLKNGELSGQWSHEDLKGTWEGKLQPRGSSKN